jgi:hypothetical protein
MRLEGTVPGVTLGTGVTVCSGLTVDVGAVGGATGVVPPQAASRAAARRRIPFAVVACPSPFRAKPKNASPTYCGSRTTSFQDHQFRGDVKSFLTHGFISM